MSALLNNWNLKLMALILAVALWSHVRGEVNPLETATFAVKLEREASGGRELLNVSSLPATVRVTIRAPRTEMRRFTGGVPSNPLAAPNEAPAVVGNLVRARLEFTNFKGQRDTVPVIAETVVEDAEILGVKPNSVVVEVAPSN